MAPLPASPLPHRTDWQGARDAIELFTLERRADKKQPSTIRYSRQQLGLFCAWLTQQGVPGDGPEDVTKALILAYRLHLQERGHTRHRSVDVHLLLGHHEQGAREVPTEHDGVEIADVVAGDQQRAVAGDVVLALDAQPVTGEQAQVDAPGQRGDAIAERAPVVVANGELLGKALHSAGHCPMVPERAADRRPLRYC